MYIATKYFKSFAQGEKDKGDKVDFNQTFLDAGLIEEAEIKPEPKIDLETKPEPKKKGKGRK